MAPAGTAVTRDGFAVAAARGPSPGIASQVRRRGHGLPVDTHPVADPAGKPRHCRTVHTDNAAGRPTVRRAAALTGALMLVTVVGCWSPDRPRRAAPARRVSSGRGRSRRLVDQPSPQRAVRCCPADVSSAVVWACRAGRSGVRATLVIGNQVIAATENDTVYALSSREWVGGVVGVVGSADARCGRLDWPSSYPT